MFIDAENTWKLLLVWLRNQRFSCFGRRCPWKAHQYGHRIHFCLKYSHVCLPISMLWNAFMLRNVAQLCNFSHSTSIEILYCPTLRPQGPHSQILMTGRGRGVRQRFIFYTQKNHNFKICLPKKITTFLAYAQKSLSPFFATQKNASVFFSRPKKIPVSFIDPKNHFWTKFQTPKKSLGPPLPRH